MKPNFSPSVLESVSEINPLSRSGTRLYEKESKLLQRGEFHAKTKHLASNFEKGDESVKKSSAFLECNDDGDEMLNQYCLGRVLGAGAYGTVYLG